VQKRSKSKNDSVYFKSDGVFALGKLCVKFVLGAVCERVASNTAYRGGTISTFSPLAFAAVTINNFAYIKRLGVALLHICRLSYKTFRKKEAVRADFFTPVGEAEK
jgi:hypothetical protein